MFNIEQLIEDIVEGVDLYCPNCGDRLGKMIEVEDQYGPARVGQKIKMRCSNCGHKWTHEAEYDTTD